MIRSGTLQGACKSAVVGELCSIGQYVIGVIIGVISDDSSEESFCLLSCGEILKKKCSLASLCSVCSVAVFTAYRSVVVHTCLLCPFQCDTHRGASVLPSPTQSRET